MHSNLWDDIEVEGGGGWTHQTMHFAPIKFNFWL